MRDEIEKRRKIEENKNNMEEFDRAVAEGRRQCHYYGKSIKWKWKWKLKH